MLIASLIEAARDTNECGSDGNLEVKERVLIRRREEKKVLLRFKARIEPFSFSLARCGPEQIGKGCHRCDVIGLGCPGLGSASGS